MHRSPSTDTLCKNKSEQEKLAFVAQNGRYGMPLSVAEYVKLGQFNPTLFSARKVNQQHLSLLLDQFELSHLRHKRINQLSGGEQQRANIVRALMQNAPVILLDEPCNHLDIRHQQSLMQFLKQHKTQFNAVMVLHDLDLAASYADHIILMQQGQIIAQGKVEDVMQSERLSAVYRWQILQKKDESGIFLSGLKNEKALACDQRLNAEKSARGNTSTMERLVKIERCF
ncbi:hemin import ATP-binding protein HmuV [Pasteurella multocida]|nr:hemin import ATP-binding protein HmuV [Pasteurella multocida]